MTTGASARWWAIMVAALGVAPLGIAACGDDADGASDGSTASTGAGAGGSSQSGATSGSGGNTTAAGPSGAGGMVNGDWMGGYAEDAVGIQCTQSAAELMASAAPRVTVGNATLLVGFHQVSGNNQDPVVARVDDDAVSFCAYHEQSGPDGRAVGVTWDGGPLAYVLYTIVGGGSELDQAADGWLGSYGPGGGGRVTVLAQIDANDGDIVHATFISAIKMDGDTNSLRPTAAVTVLADGGIEVLGSSAHKPRNPDRTSMDCTDYPFDYRAIFEPDLDAVRCASSTNCTSQMDCP